jgi:hypothetical protein
MNYKDTLKIKWAGENSHVKFNYLAGINRPIYPAQVTKLANSINKMSIIRPVVVATIQFITGKPLLYLIDGQHLFNALIRNGMEIPYVSIEVKDKRDLVEKIALLNASSKTWAMVDYILAWSSLSEDYVKLNHYYQVYDMDLGFLASVLGNSSSDGGNISKKIKLGEFKIIEESKNVDILNKLTDILKIIPRMDRRQNRYVCGEYVRFLRTEGNYNHKHFLLNLEKNKKQFLLATQEEGKLSEMFKKLK